MEGGGRSHHRGRQRRGELYPRCRRHARDAALEKGVVPGPWSLGSDTLRARRIRGGCGSSRRSRPGWARPLQHQGRLSRSGLRLLDVFIVATSARLTPEYGRLCVGERSLSSRHFRSQGRVGVGIGAPVPGALGVVLCRARRIQVTAVALCRARGGQLKALPRGWRELAPRRPRARCRLFSESSLQTGESTRSVSVPWRYPLVLSLVSSPEPASGGPPRLESSCPSG